MYKGKVGFIRLCRFKHAKKYSPDVIVKSEPRDSSYQQAILNSEILEVIYYKDSIAGIISRETDTKYYCAFLAFEYGKWWNLGDDRLKSIDEARKHFYKFAEQQYLSLKQNMLIKSPAKNPGILTQYLKVKGEDPIKFVIDKLKEYKLVAYGEIHRRPVSWNLCKSVLNNPAFVQTVGTIFMELPAHKQKTLDEFFSSDSINRELVLEVFRDMTNSGWIDKGMFDFILDLWKVNKELAPDQKIRLIACDNQCPYDQIKTMADYENYFMHSMDRDSFMAMTISRYLTSNLDSRHCLFIVGMGHLCRSTNSAGSLLNKYLESGQIFTIATHGPSIDNQGNIYGRVREGSFDSAFFKYENMKVAFALKNSPFGSEAFDLLQRQNIFGTYEQNYDGYIFLGPLDSERASEYLFDLYSDSFIKELDRRWTFTGRDFKKDWNIQELSKKAIVESILKDSSSTRWGKELKALKVK